MYSTINPLLPHSLYFILHCALKAWHWSTLLPCLLVLSWWGCTRNKMKCCTMAIHMAPEMLFDFNCIVVMHSDMKTSAIETLVYSCLTQLQWTLLISQRSLIYIGTSFWSLRKKVWYLLWKILIRSGLLILQMNKMK